MILTTSMLREKYRDYSNQLDKIKREVDNNNLYRLNRGLYETNKNTDPYFLAQALLSPSYISFDWALSYYGLIPERVIAITSASLNKRKNITFNNYFGRFEYSDIPDKVFKKAITLIKDNGYVAKIATKEKAICDSLYKWPPIYSVKALKELMFIDKRIDIDEFEKCDFKLMYYLSNLYKRRNLHFLRKLIKEEYLNE